MIVMYSAEMHTIKQILYFFGGLNEICLSESNLFSKISFPKIK